VLDDRASAGQHRAAEQRRLCMAEVGVDLHARAARHHRLLGEAGHTHMVIDRPAIQTQPALTRKQRPCAVAGRARLAQRRPALHTGHAGTSTGHEDEAAPMTAAIGGWHAPSDLATTC